MPLERLRREPTYGEIRTSGSGRRGWKRPFRYLKRLNAPTSYFHFSVRKNPLDSSRGEVNPQRPDRAVRAFFVREAEAAWDKQKSCPSQEAGRAAFVVGECSMAERSRHTERMGVTSCHPCRPCRPCRRHRQQAFRRRHHPPLRTRGQRRPIRWSAACRPRTRRSPARSA